MARGEDPRSHWLPAAPTALPAALVIFTDRLTELGSTQDAAALHRAVPAGRERSGRGGRLRDDVAALVLEYAPL